MQFILPCSARHNAYLSCVRYNYTWHSPSYWTYVDHQNVYDWNCAEHKKCVYWTYCTWITKICILEQITVTYCMWLTSPVKWLAELTHHLHFGCKIDAEYVNINTENDRPSCIILKNNEVPNRKETTAVN